MIANLHLRDGRIEFRWKRWRNKKRQEVSYCLMVLLSGMVLLGGGGAVEAGPTGGQVTGGTGTITYGGATTTINQQSQVLTINWQTFSTAPNESVNFNQPGSTSLAINYVVGGVPSVLEGALNATGRVYILNSAGITFTGTSHVNVGALLATTAMTVTGDPTASASFSGSGAGQVINRGSIQVSDGGFAILAAPYVENTGFIKADLGTIALAGTNKFTLDLRGDGLINFVVPPDAVEKIKADGDKVGVNNTGKLQARSGQVLISASVATQVVNAAVNLNGVVDASAFAPDGQGGSVLVTSEGDINLGGQVNAAGAGTGAGGQIITKAAGADKIEAGATVAAAGGDNGGKGGLIEVSGHDVLLSGNINPGSGGTLLVDPANFTIINGGTGQGVNFIGEKRVEGILQNGVNFVASATDQIIMQDLTDNVLQGGNGDLTLHAGNAIVFQGTNDAIVTKGGDITMTAGAGGIGVAGGPGHTVDLISNAAGVNQAGDIVLSATGGIDVKSVTIKSGGASAFHAHFTADAGGNFSAAGPIDVAVAANGTGAQGADAEIHITAGNALTLHGVNAKASAVENGGGGNVAATAFIDLNAPIVHDFGNASVTAVIGGHSGLRFGAVADLSINAPTDVTITGRSLVTASGNVFSVSFENVTAFANVRGGNVDLASFNVGALGLANHVGNDVVHASAALVGEDVSVTGAAGVRAVGVAAEAAYVQAHGNFDISGSKVAVGGNATARATADNQNLGRSASASANLFVQAGAGNASFGGSIAVQALSLNGGGSKDADARANFGIVAQGIEVADNVIVTANGQTLHVAGNQSSTPHASAVVSMTAASGDILIDGLFYVVAQASSQNHDSAVAKAKAHLSAAGAVDIQGLTGVFANVVTDATHFFANRSNLPPPQGALGSAALVIDAGGDVDLGHLLVQVNAIDAGNFQAQAFADALITANGNITANSYEVLALAHQTNALGGFTANGSAIAGLTLDAEAGDVTVGHFANGGADFVGGAIDVVANEFDHGAGAGFASALVNVVARNAPEGADILVGDVTVDGSASHWAGALTRARGQLTMNATAGIDAGNVDVAALANDHGPKAADASALASFAAGGAVTLGAITDVADASNHGGGAAKAVADVTIDPTVVAIGGPIKLSADALNFTGHGLAGNGASADASLNFVNAATVQVAGDVSVVAHGTNHGSGRVNAVGAFNFAGVTSLDLQDVTIDVAALNVGHGTGGARAYALFSVGTGVALSLHGLNLQADASSNGTGGAVAHAIGHIEQADVAIGGDVTANAKAVTGTHALGNADALASVLLSADNGNVSVGAVDVEALGSDHGAGNALANAQTGIFANGSEIGGGVVIGSLVDQAVANDAGAGSAKAVANVTIDPGTIDIAGDVTVLANAFNLGGHGNSNMGASADAELTFGSSAIITDNVVTQALVGGVNAHVVGDIDIVAHATNEGSGKVNAQGIFRFGGASTLDLHDLTIDVAALNKGNGTGGAKADASFIAGPGIALTLHGLNLQADASSNGNGGAVAHAIGDVSRATISIAGDVTVNAKAVTGSHALGNAEALASLHLAATSSFGNVTVGAVDVEALANDQGAGNALANAQTGIFASGFEGGGVTIASLLDKASATNAGAGFAQAIAAATIDPQQGSSGVAHVLGNASVLAHANNLGSGVDGVAASADAQLRIDGFRTVEVDGNAVASAHATNHGSGSVNAHAGMEFGSAFSIDLGGVQIDVSALNQGTGAGGPGAHAVASFVHNSGFGHLTIGSGGINVQAAAGSERGGGATANALVDIEQGSVSVAGGVSVGANAFNGAGGAGNANAIANLNLIASSFGSVTVDGHIDVEALANDLGAGNALASAGLTASAFEGGVTIGSLTDKASANNSGAGFAKAKAVASIDPSGVIHIGGNASAIANAVNNGTGVDGVVAASADAQLHFDGAGTLEVVNNVVASAHATNHGLGSVNAHAGMDFGSIGSINVGGIQIDVTALNQGSGASGPGAHATASFVHTGGGHLTVGSNGINVQAVASSHRGGNATANALVDFEQGSVSIGGGVQVGANAFNGSGGEGNANALANLHLAATSSSGSVYVGGHIDVEALANDLGAGNALANAQTGIFASGFEGGGVWIGSLTDKASANNWGGGFAKAVATASIDPPGVLHIDGNASAVANADNHDAGVDGVVAASADAHLNLGGFDTIEAVGIAVASAHATNHGLGSVNAHAGIALGSASSINLDGIQIDVTALNQGSGASGPGAQATASFVHTGGGYLTVGSNGINVQAVASSHRGGNATANALVDIEQGSVSVAGGVSVGANAFNGAGGAGNANALSNLVLDATSGSVTVDGHIDVEALANDLGNGNALANAQTDIFASGFATVFGGVTIGSLTDKASANNSGGGYARANAVASIDPPGVIHIGGNASVIANAVNNGTGVDGVVAASADAQLHFDGAGTLEVVNNVVASAHATNHGLGSVNAHAGMDFGSIGSINVGGIQIDVTALNQGSGASGPGAHATASFVHTGGGHLTVGSNGINVQAVASSHRGGNATANALVDFEQGSVSIGGGVQVGANAFNGSGGEGNANALANLHLAATSSSGSVYVGGHIDVEALANDLGAGNALANAQTGIFASGFEGGGVWIGSLTDKANANNWGGGFAKAVATASIDPPGVLHIDGNASAIANADNHDAGVDGVVAASADAHLNLGGFDTIEAVGIAVASAHATNHGLGSVNAHAGIALGSASSINVGGIQIDVTALNQGSGASGPGAQATASFVHTGGGYLTVGSNGINVQAVASSHRGGNATANALVDIEQSSVSIGGGVQVGANAFNGSGGEGNANALSNLVLDATSGSVNVGDIDVEALANDLGAGNAIASGLGEISANSGDVGGGGVFINSLRDNASALNAGGGVAKALASVTFDPPGTTHIYGNASAVAHASNLGGGGGTVASANAELTFVGTGPITVDGNAVASAHATNSGSSGRVNAHAGMDFGSATAVTLNGVQVDVRALNAGGSGATATAAFVQNNAAVHLAVGTGGINVQALASSRDGGGAFANALVDIEQDFVSIAGDVTVDANAFNGLGSLGEGSGAHALANLELNGGAVSLSGGSVEVDGHIDVEALANDLSTGDAIASALTGIHAGNGQGVVIGSLTDKASADNAGGGFAQAIASATIDPPVPGVEHILGNASVIADAHNAGGSGNGSLGASANAQLHFAGFSSVMVDGNAVASAHATNSGSAGVKANGGMDFGGAHTITLHGVLIDVSALNSGGAGATATAAFVQTNAAVHLAVGTGGINVQALANSQDGGGALANTLVDIEQGSVSIAGGVQVGANAFNGSGGEGNANALSNLVLDATSGSVTVGGHIDVEALAVDQGAGLALANAQTEISASSSEGSKGGVSIGSLIDRASATNSGGGYARAIADANIDPPGVLHIDGNASVIANADNLGGPVSGPIAASADAELSLDGFATVEVGGNAVASAHATNHASAGVNAHGGVDLGSAANIDLGGVQIDVSALNLGTAGGGAGAVAQASFVQNNGAVHLAIGTGGLNVQALASSLGHMGASANALADIQQHGIGIDGDVLVGAKALGGPNVTQRTRAHANLLLDASTGSVDIGGGVNVAADANSQGIHGGIANASADLLGASVTVDGLAHASAVARGGTASSVLAYAQFDASAAAGDLSLGGLEITANATANDPLEVLAVATGSLHAAGGLHIDQDAVLAAFASTNATAGDPAAGDVNAVANLRAAAGSSVEFGGALDVTAQDHANKAHNALARAQADVEAGNATGNIAFDGDVLVQADVQGGSGAGTAVAFAILDANAGNAISFSGDMTVNAHTLSAGSNVAFGAAMADLQANAIEVDGDVSVSASGHGLGDVQNAGAVASFLANADVGGLLLEGDLGVDAKGVAPGSSLMPVRARANLQANDGVTVDGDINVAASLTGNGLGAGILDLASIGIPIPVNLRIASASLAIDARHGDVDLGGVTVLANADLTATGTPHSEAGAGTAGARARAHISADQGDLTISGPTDVGANATDLANGDHALALASLDAFAKGDLEVGNVTVTADLAAANAHNASAMAFGRLSASGSHLAVDGPVDIGALANAGSGVSGNVAAIAALRTAAPHGTVAFANGIVIDANAVDLSGLGGAAAYANGDIVGEAGVTIAGPTKVTAELKTNTRGGGDLTFALAGGDAQTVDFGWARAGLSIDPSGASAGIKTGAITVEANADLMAAGGPNSGGAGAYLNMAASNGSVVINGPLLVTGEVVGHGTQGGNASAVASARIYGRHGVSLGSASVLAVASALGGGIGQDADAEAVLALLANDGNIHGNIIDAAAIASHMGSGGEGVAHANTLTSIDAASGNVDIIGGLAIALAIAPKDSVSYAAASAALDIHAGHNLAVHGGGLFAEALANGTFGQAPGHANALIDVTAGSDISIAGNITALAASKGSHSGQVATANIFVQAGTEGFGNLSIFGNVVALASADPVNDHALASVTLAANHILIVGADPIASANAGAVSTFLKTHFTSRRQRHGANGSSAQSRITIITDPGGLVVINDSGGGSTGTGGVSGFSRTNADALLAMPIYDQTYPSGGLRPIPLAIAGKACGVLGDAGQASKNGDQKPPACDQPPINISGVVDGP